MGMRGALVCVILEPGLARRTGVPRSDVSPDFGDGQLGIFLADLPRSRAGWNIGYSNQDHRGGKPDLCVQVRDTCPSGFGGRDDCQQTVTTARPLREDPYYFDIRHDDGNVTRHWFSLRR